MKTRFFNYTAAALVLSGAAICQVFSQGAPSLEDNVQKASQLYGSHKFDEAKQLFDETLKKAEQNGPKDTNIGSCLNGLGLIAEQQGHADEAADLYKRAIEAKETAVGPDDASVATVIMNLAKLDASQGKATDAEALFNRAIAIREKALGADSPDLAVSLNGLAHLYQEQKKYAQAEPLVNRSL